MSAVGAITGDGVYSELVYKDRIFQVGQWTIEAMDAVSTAAFRAAGAAALLLGGDAQANARREAALARLFAMGHFNFDAIVQDGGLDENNGLLAVFLWRLLAKHDGTVTLELAREMVETAKADVAKAVARANPHKVPTNTAATAAPAPAAA
jgi:hypothetical protein